MCASPRTLAKARDVALLAVKLNGKMLALLILLSCITTAIRAQDTATIVGTVTDSSGAVMPDVKVRVSNAERGFVREVASNSAGEYTAARIPIGNYTVTAEVTGFQRLLRSGIALTAGQTQRVDLALTVGQLTQEIQVQGNVARVETENATVSDVVTSKQIQNLTLNGLNFGTLTFLTPGAVQDNGYSEAQQLGHSGAEVGVAYNGNRIEYSNLELDGGNNSQESSTAMGGAVTPALDSIAEFRISTSNYGADVGQHAGALVEVVTKGGTKDFHGSAYEFVRNDALDANDWFANQQIAPPGGKAPKTPLKWNIFGYTLGGPFYIPHHYNTSKSKTFFFWSQQWARYRQGTVGNWTTLTPLMRQGNFSECDPAQPAFFSQYISDQGCVLPTNLRPGDLVGPDTVRVDPNAAAFLNAYVPLPNNGIDGYVSAHSRPTNFSQSSIRVDQNLSDKASLFVRFTNDEWKTTVVPALWTGSSYDTTQSIYSVPARQTVLHLNYNFRPNLLNEFIVSYTDTPHTITPGAGPGSPAHSILKPSTWTASNLIPANASNQELPGLSIDGGTSATFGVDNGYYVGKYDAEPVYVYKDNVAWTKGSHTLKFGFFLEKFQLTEQRGFDTQGYFTFNNKNPITTGNALADMYLGRIAQYQEGTLNFNGVQVGGYGFGHWRRTDFEPYFQDDWKVNRRLTLNFGVRYYLLIPPHDVSKPTIDSSFIPSLYDPGRAASLDANGNLVKDSATGHVFDFTSTGNGLVECGIGVIVKGCQTTYYKNIGPRFGFAFDPTGSGKTSIRGGYGIYYEPGNGNDANTIGLQGNPPALLAPVGYNLASYQTITPGAYGPAGILAIPYSQKNPSVHQLNLNVQHEFAGNNILTVAYVGTLGRHLDTGRNLNQIPVGVGTKNVPALSSGNGGPCDVAGNCDVQNLLTNNQVNNIFFLPYQGFARIGMKQFTGVSSYHALQTNFRHTTGYGLTLQAAYTWSHLIDNATSTYFETDVDDNSNLNRWKGTSDLNRTHVFTVNYIYALPFFRSSGNGFLKQALGGWQVSGITSFFTGQPTDFGCGVNGYSTGIGTGVRCNTVGPLKIKKGMTNDPVFGPMVTWFDPSVITQPVASQLTANNEPGMFGYMGRNVLTGPGRNNWDLALSKEFPLPWFRSEHSTLQFRFETFNTFNHPQWQYVNTGCSGSIGFGQPCTQVGNAEVNSAWAPRNIQLGMRFIF
jgi:hypothetical protein